MAKKPKTKRDFWETPEEHSKVKHFILKKYLDQWLPKLAQKWAQVAYIDAYAGRGIYKDGSPGSPIIALEAFKNHALNAKMKEVLFFFLEPDDEAHASLDAELMNYEAPTNAKVQWERDTFQEFLESLIEFLRTERGGTQNCPPSFWFIDPFGLDVEMSSIREVSELPQSEVFLHLMTGHIKRFCNEETHRKSISGLMGDGTFASVLHSTESTTWDVVEFYGAQIEKHCSRFKYVLPFELIPKKAAHGHHLVFATQSVHGFIAMKTAMWKVDPTGDYSFSAKQRSLGEFAPMQTLLFEEDKVASQLSDILIAKYAGQAAVTIDEVVRFVNEETFT